MANQLVEAMKIGEEKARREMQIAEDAYNEQWRDQVDWGPQDPEPGEPVFGTDETGQTFFEFVKNLQINPDLARLHNSNKAGNVDEVWKIRNHPNYKSLPSEEQLQKNIEKLKGLIQTSMNPEAQRNLLIQGVKTFKEGGGEALRNLLKPNTVPDQFGHPTGSFRELG